MSLAFDPAYLPALEPWMPILASRPVPKLHEYLVIRQSIDELFGTVSKSLGFPDGIAQERFKFTSYDGAEIEIMYTHHKTPPPAAESASGPSGATTTGSPAIVHAHGGGMVGGSIDAFSTGIAFNSSLWGLPIFSINYRKAPEHPFPAPPEDVYAGLQWVQANAAKFNVDPARLAIYGESAGGGLAAAVALMARDRGLHPPLAKQVLIYPMLDDRNLQLNKALEPFATWNNVSNITGWSAYVGKDKAGSKEDGVVSPYAAPARAKDLSGLPRTYIDVGELDLFKVEDMEYATRLAMADVPLEFHVYPGVPHAFEGLAPGIEMSKKARENRVRAMRDF